MEKNAIHEYNIDEEEICGFRVSSKRKMVWKKELEILELVQKLCNSNNIKYFAIGGTLLGAVRHKGFIPWDDDIDIGMERKDYDRFVKLALDSCPSPFFFQSVETDTKYYLGNVRIRNSQTTAISSKEMKLSISYNQGIWLSIFPLDNIPDNKLLLWLHKKSVCIVQNIISKSQYGLISQSNSVKRNLGIIISKIIASIFGISNVYHLHDRLSRLFNKSKTKKMALTSTFYKSEKRMNFDKQSISRTKTVPFENMFVDIPLGYNEILTSYYGQWKEYVIANSEHGSTFFDPNTPYTYYKDGHLDLVLDYFSGNNSNI